MNIHNLDDFTLAYLECALWAENDNSDESGGVPFDDNYGIEDIAPETLEKMVADCRDFQESNATDLGLYYKTYSRISAGHDFWLTRHGHGAGFWDRGLGQLGERLTKASKPYGSFYLYIGDDNLIHGD